MFINIILLYCGFVNTYTCVLLFRGGTRMNKQTYIRKRRNSPSDGTESIKIKMEPLSISKPKVAKKISHSNSEIQKDGEDVGNQLENDGEEVTLVKMIGKFLKILLFGFCVFCYDMTSKSVIHILSVSLSVYNKLKILNNKII